MGDRQTDGKRRKLACLPACGIPVRSMARNATSTKSGAIHDAALLVAGAVAGVFAVSIWEKRRPYTRRASCTCAPAASGRGPGRVRAVVGRALALALALARARRATTMVREEVKTTEGLV